MVNLEIGKLYIADKAPHIFIFRVLDTYFDRHKYHKEYKIEAVVPNLFYSNIPEKVTKSGWLSDTEVGWIRDIELFGVKELPKDHPAWILYGN